ncbi:MAG: hypothetical protein U9Q06_02350 [Nanoarchaeota archaeon]|nr:hypothetical protein [Nanoarchaeota archaeon]
MVEKDKITLEKIKRAGIFDFKETYQFVYRWLTEEDYDVEEEKYQETAKGDTKDIEIMWVCKKKVSDYFRLNLKLGWRVLGLKKIEVEKDGKRIKMDDGSFEVKITGTLERDYENKWDKNPSMKFLRGIYDKFIIEGTKKGYENKVFGDVEELSEQIKAFLAITGLK